MRIAVIDDHPLVFDAVASVLRHVPGTHDAAGFGDLDAFARSLANDAAPDLVLLDLGLPGYAGLRALAEYRARHEEIPVVVLSGAIDRETILGALDLGAMGFIPKTSRREVFVAALEIVASGGVYVPAEALDGRRRSHAEPPRERVPSADTAAAAIPAALHGLTVRQRDVLMLLIKGLPNKSICRQLDLSPNTVKTHVSAIFRVLDVANRTQAVLAAQSLGIRVPVDSRDASRAARR